MEQTKENKMGVMPVNQLLITMSLPMVVSMLVQVLFIEVRHRMRKLYSSA